MGARRFRHAVSWVWEHVAQLNAAASLLKILIGAAVVVGAVVWLYLQPDLYLSPQAAAPFAPQRSANAAPAQLPDDHSTAPRLVWSMTGFAGGNRAANDIQVIGAALADVDGHRLLFFLQATERRAEDLRTAEVLDVASLTLSNAYDAIPACHWARLAVLEYSVQPVEGDGAVRRNVIRGSSCIGADADAASRDAIADAAIKLRSALGL
jgi:hypothetical protein